MQNELLKVEIKQLTPWSLALDAARETMGRAGLGKEPSDEWKAKLLDCEHSVIRRVRYEIKFTNLKSWVSVHLVRHKFGVEHFVKSQRDDRNPDRVISRDDAPQGTLISHVMDINAQEVMFISHRRLCGQASPETREAWALVKKEMEKIDPILASRMVPMCVYRGGQCHELRKCSERQVYSNDRFKVFTTPAGYFVYRVDGIGLRFYAHFVDERGYKHFEQALGNL